MTGVRAGQAWDEALAAVVGRRGELVGYASLLTGERSAADGLVREAIVRVFARRRAWRDAEDALAAVRALIVTRFLHAGHGVLVDRAAGRLRTEGDVLRDEDRLRGPSAVTGALWMLGRRERACVVLRHVDGMPVEAIAERVGIAPSEVAHGLDEAATILRSELGLGEGSAS